MDVDRGKIPENAARAKKALPPRSASTARPAASRPPAASQPVEIGRSQPPSPLPTKTSHRRRPVLVPVAGAFTFVAFIIALAHTFLLGSQVFDWMSPPFAAVGTVLIIIAVVRKLKPRQLAASTLVLIVTYWLYYVLIAISL